MGAIVMNMSLEQQMDPATVLAIGAISSGAREGNHCHFLGLMAIVLRIRRVPCENEAKSTCFIIGGFWK